MDASPAPSPAAGKPPGLAAFLPLLAFDIVAPIVTYEVLHARGAHDAPALAVSAVFPAASVVVKAVRRGQQQREARATP